MAKPLHNDAFREGARSYDPQDVCPGCGGNRIIFASDFKKLGRHKVRACADCKAVFVDGDKQADLTMFAESRGPTDLA